MLIRDWRLQVGKKMESGASSTRSTRRRDLLLRGPAIRSAIVSQILPIVSCLMAILTRRLARFHRLFAGPGFCRVFAVLSDVATIRTNFLAVFFLYRRRLLSE